MYIEQFVKIDTQLNIEATVKDILQVTLLRLSSGEMTWPISIVLCIAK